MKHLVDDTENDENWSPGDENYRAKQVVRLASQYKFLPSHEAAALATQHMPDITRSLIHIATNSYDSLTRVAASRVLGNIAEANKEMFSGDAVLIDKFFELPLMDRPDFIMDLYIKRAITQKDYDLLNRFCDDALKARVVRLEHENTRLAQAVADSKDGKQIEGALNAGKAAA